jgi:hypothetical protein
MVDSIFGVVLLLTAHIKEATVHLSVDTRTALGASSVLNFWYKEREKERENM